MTAVIYKPLTDEELMGFAELQVSAIRAGKTVASRLVEQARRANQLANAFEKWLTGTDADDPEGGADLLDACTALDAYRGET